MLRSAEEESLGGVASGILEIAELVARLHTLGDDGQVQRVPKLDHRPDDGYILGLSGNPRTNERSIFSASIGKSRR